MDGETFLEAMELRVDNGRVVGAGDSDRMRDRMVKEKWTQLYSVGWEVCTVVNCLSWAVEVHTGYGYFRVPAPDKKKGEMFHTHVVRVPSMDMKDLGEGRYVPDPVMPVEIVREFELKYKDEGGVFWFRGDKHPENIGELVRAAHEKMEAWMKRRYAEGQANWARWGKNPFFIDDRMRDSAKFLYERKQIPELPEWVTVTRDDASTFDCPACAEVVRKAAKVCVHCGYAIDAAFAKTNAERLGAKAAVQNAPVEAKPEEPKGKTR